MRGMEIAWKGSATESSSVAVGCASELHLNGRRIIHGKGSIATAANHLSEVTRIPFRGIL